MPYFSMVGCADGLTPQILNVLRTKDNALAASNSAKMAADFSVVLGRPAHYLPSTYPLGQKLWRNPQGERDDVVCFGRLFSLKNVASQVVAALKFSRRRGKKLRFHINSFVDHGGDGIMQLLPLLLFRPESEFVAHRWMPKRALYEFLATMTVGLQVSFTEASNVMTMDYASVGLPMVVSREIKWAHPCSIAYPTDTDEIVEKMGYAAAHPEVVDWNRTRLDSHNNSCVGHWLRFFGPEANPRVLFLYHTTPNGQETGISNAATNDSALLRSHGIYAAATATDFSRANVARCVGTQPWTHVVYEASFANLLYV